MPYSKTLEEEKKAHCYNPNIKIFEVQYDDSAFNNNQKKIEKISKSIINQSSEEKGKKRVFKNLRKCNGVVVLKIINKKIIIGDANEIKEEIKEEKKIKDKDNKENSNRKKKLSMFEFFNNIKEKLDEFQEEKEKEKIKKKEEKKEVKKEVKKEEVKKEESEEGDEEEEEEESDEEDKK